MRTTSPRPLWSLVTFFALLPALACTLPAGAQVATPKPIDWSGLPGADRALPAIAQLDLKAAAPQATGQTPAQQTSPARPPMPSLNDLGFPSSQTQANPALQARLDRRSRMLQIHQKLGLLTAIPLAATVISGAFAGGHRNVTSRTGRNVHMALGITTAAMYTATAYYAIAAPHIHGVKTRGQTRAHIALAYIHLPGMILTPILGAMAYSQRSKGERVHGIARWHGQVAVITLGAYVAALLVEARPHFASNTSRVTTHFLAGTGRRALALLHLRHAQPQVAANAYR